MKTFFVTVLSLVPLYCFYNDNWKLGAVLVAGYVIFVLDRLESVISAMHDMAHDRTIMMYQMVEEDGEDEFDHPDYEIDDEE